MKYWLAIVTVLAAACGDNTARPDAALDSAPDAPLYPAFAPPVLQVMKGPGSVMPNVRVVPAFFPGDPLHAQLVDFLGKLAGSSTWSQMTSEYGVGALTVASPVDIATAPPANLTNDQIAAFLADQLSGSHPEWGATDPATLMTTVYVLFYPAATTVSLNGVTSCNWGSPTIGGYHQFTTGSVSATYAVIPRCTTPMFGTSVLDYTTYAISHELVEAATDPRLDAWAYYAADDLPWPLITGGEVADLCQDFTSSRYVPAELGYMVQRSFSNASVAAFHDPCVPVPPGAGPYFNAVPDRPDAFTISVGTQTFPTHGLSVPVGQTKTIALRLWSEGPTAGPWTITPYDFSPEHALDITLDRNTGLNGDTLELTVHTKSATQAGYASVGLVSTLAGRDTAWPLLVATPH